MFRVVGSSRSLSVGRSQQKIRFAGGVCQILVNNFTILPFLVKWVKNAANVFHQTRATRGCGELHNTEAGRPVIGDTLQPTVIQLIHELARPVSLQSRLATFAYLCGDRPFTRKHLTLP